MFLIYLVLFVLLVGFINFLINKFKRDKKLHRKFYDFGDGNFIVYTVITLITSYVLINSLIDEPKFSGTKDQIAYGEKTTQPWLVSDAYKSRILKDTMNLDDQYAMLKWHFNEYQYQCPDVRRYDLEGVFMFNYYTGLSGSSYPDKADVGRLFLGIYYCMKNDYTNGEDLLNQVENKKIKYLNNYLGIIHYYNHKREEGIANFQQEIKLKGYLQGAYYNLSRYYNYEHRVDLLKTLVYNPASARFIPYEFRKEVYVINQDLGSYFSSLLDEIFKNTNMIGFVGALLILLIWIFYLRSVNIQRKTSWGVMFFVVLFSAILVFPVWLLYDFYKYALHFELTGGVANDFFYCVFGIGVIEEIVKIIPFLLVLRFTKVIKDPMDYIVFASLSALGFAFVENFTYFRDGSLNIMHSRALTASVSHMIDSSIVAYGLILAKFRYKKSQILYFFIFFLIACFSHGFYDFWLLNDVVSEYFIVTFLLLLTCILVYASFINNALNNPENPGGNIQMNTSRLASNLAASLLGIFIFEFISLSLIYGPVIGDRELLTSTLGGGYLILFLSVRLSNIDVFPGDWSRIDFFVGLSPVQIIYGDKKPNFNTAIGARIRFRALKKKGKLAEILPVEGEIVKRLKISGFTGWFLVRLSTPLPYLKLNKEYILVRAKNQMELIGREEEVIIYFMCIADMTLLDSDKKQVDDFRFMEWAIAGKPVGNV